jgi:4-amino-4-deoxy-L-arabinose transferase-like glycosyltransferase
MPGPGLAERERAAPLPGTTTTAPPPEPAPAGPEAGAGRHREVVLIVAAVLVGAALRAAIGLTDDAPTTDETAYLRSGLSLVAGDGFARGGHPELHFPPLVPFLLGQAARVFGDPHTGTVVLTWLTATAVIVPLALLGRRLAGPAGGIATAWVAALAPAQATLPAARGAGSEALYTLLVVTAVWLVVAAAGRRGRARLAQAAGAGLGVGLAYLTRPEGLLFAAPLAIGLLLPLRRAPRAAAGLVAAFALPLAACLVPYASYLHDHTGRWQVTAKTQDASLEAWHAVARSDREARDAVLYGLDESGVRFPTGRSSLPALARDDPAGYAAIVATNVTMLGRNVAGWWLLPLPVWAVAALGAWRLRRSGTARLLLAVAALPVATSLAFFVQPRYLVLTAAMAVVLAGAGLATVGRPRRRLVTGGVLAVCLAASLGAFVGPGGWWHPGDHTDQRLAGEWVADRAAPDDRVMTRSFVVEHYAGRPAVAVPYADLDEIVAFARHYGVRWLVVDEQSSGRLRPQLLPLLEGGPPPGLRLAAELEAEGRTTRVFALDPAPPPSRETPPGLGFMGDGGS